MMSPSEYNEQVLGFSNSLKYFAIKLTMDDEKAKDLVQETMYKAFANRSKFVKSTNLKAWLYTIMKNTFINNYRSSVKANTIVDKTKDLFYINSSEAVAIESPESELAMKEIMTEVSDLSDDYRVPLTMYFEGFKYKEIAEELELPIGTVKSRIFLARKQLMQNLSDYTNKARKN